MPAEIPPLPAGCPLTPRQWQVLHLSAYRSQKRVAFLLGVSPTNIRTTLYRARVALGARTTEEARDIVRRGAWPGRRDTRPEARPRNAHDRRESDPVTPAQFLYLGEFDKYLATPDWEFGVSSPGMKHHLRSIYMERGIDREPHVSQRKPSLYENIVAVPLERVVSDDDDQTIQPRRARDPLRDSRAAAGTQTGGRSDG